VKRRDLLKSTLAGAAALTAPAIVKADAQRTITFVPHADLASFDPVWTTADITRNFSLAVFDTLYGFDAKFTVQPQMVEGHRVEDDGKLWELTLRDGLRFHDKTPVLARDCVATVKRWAVRYPMGQALMARVDEMTALSDKVIRIRLKKPFALLPTALGDVNCAIMPERLAQTDPMKQIAEPIGSGPFRFVASERIPGARVVYEKNPDYVPRSSGEPSFYAGPKVVYVDRVIWTFIPDPATASAALMQGEIDWWENPTVDLVPQLRTNKDLEITVKDRTGEIGCLRFNHLYPPFDNAAVRRVVLSAFDQKEIMTAVAGAEPSLIKTDVGIFVPGTPMASDVGVEVTRGPKYYAKIKQDLAAAGYKGEKIVVLAAQSIPSIFAEAQVATDVLKRIGLDVDFRVSDWGTVVQRRASKEPPDKGGWNVFYTYLGGFGNISPAPDIAIRGNGAGAWFGWPNNPKMEELRDAWFEAPDLAAQQKICREMQVVFFQDPPYVPLGMYDSPTAFHRYLKDIHDGWPQFYGVQKTA
jgi:peptide/nickel transport system substrate-binding protein